MVYEQKQYKACKKYISKIFDCLGTALFLLSLTNGLEFFAQMVKFFFKPKGLELNLFVFIPPILLQLKQIPNDYELKIL